MNQLNQQIDSAILKHVQSRKPHDKIRGTSFLQALYPLKLQAREDCIMPYHWWLQDLANRSCQRLRKKGMIQFDSKKGWLTCN